MRSAMVAIEESLERVQAQLQDVLNLPGSAWSGGSRQLFEDGCARVLAGLNATRASTQQLRAAGAVLEAANAEVCAALTGAYGG